MRRSCEMPRALLVTIDDAAESGRTGIEDDDDVAAATDDDVTMMTSRRRRVSTRRCY